MVITDKYEQATDIGIEKTAKRMDINPQTLRIGLQQNVFPFGYAIQTSEDRYTYYIHDGRFELWMQGKL